MIADQNSIINKLVPIIKIIKDREQVYFDALSFANKNIESTFNDFDQIYIFTKFLKSTAEKQAQLNIVEEEFLQGLAARDQFTSEPLKLNNNSKQMMRLYTRAHELIEEAIERARKSLFGDNGKLSIDYARFKKSLLKVVKQNPIDIYDFSSLFINFSKAKYRKQIGKLKTYLHRLQVGDQVSLRDMFAAKQQSDASSPDQRVKIKSISKTGKKNSNKEQTSQTQSPTHKRPSTRKVSHGGSKTKKNLNLKSVRKDEEVVEKSFKQKKKENATKLLGYYKMMELNKKQFLEDYIFEKNEEDEKKNRLMTILLEKNKFNDDQICQYYHKCQEFNPAKHLLPNPSSDQNQTSCIHRNQSSISSRMSLKTSFVISKRKPSFTHESPTERSEGEPNKSDLPFSRTIRNFSTGKKPASKSIKSSRPKQGNSKKIFVVKSPMVFQDDVIPKVQMNNTNQWIQQPLTGSKDVRSSRKNQPLRLKKRNNPCPLDNSFLPESFQFTQYPV